MLVKTLTLNFATFFLVLVSDAYCQMSLETSTHESYGSFRSKAFSTDIDKRYAVSGVYIKVFETKDGGSFTYVRFANEEKFSVNVKSLENSTSIEVYPNPTKEWLSFKSSEDTKVTCLEIFSVSGQNVIKTRLSSSADAIKVSQIPPGLYLVKFTMLDGTVANKRIVISD